MKIRCSIVCATIALLVSFARAETAHTFQLDTSSWDTQPTSINVAGDFNGWSATAQALVKKGTIWSATVKLTEGQHQYKFVADKERWIQDPAADPALDADDGNGGKNSGVVIAKDAAPNAPAAKGYTFSIDVSSWEQKPTSLAVAGDFNNWNKDATPMKPKGQIWSATVPLADGPHAYKFVADGERWLQDPAADTSLDADDGNGGKNSVVVIAKNAAVKPTPPAAPADGKAAAGHKFVLDTSTWDQKPRTVNLAGDFNGWSKDAMPMRADGAVWSYSVALPEGPHEYKFVIDGNKWLPDPAADVALQADDGNGGFNSGMIAGPDARSLPPVAANAIRTEALQFDPKSESDVNVVSDTELRVRIRVQRNDAQHVYVRAGASADLSTAPRTELHNTGSLLGYDSYGGTVTVPAAMAGKTIDYAFELVDGAADVMWAGNKPATTVQEIALSNTFTTPAWAEKAVWYQIFPERFKNGDPSNDPDNGPNEHMVRWTSRWFDAQPGEDTSKGQFQYDGPGNVFDRRYGGDIQGIDQSLPYLKSLGITAIYLNPIFEAASMHKYDTTDYRHVDEHFGIKGDWPVAGETDDPATWQWSSSDKVFLDFVADAHKQGFKVVLDGVFNHVGRPCPFFQDVLENGKNSKYADWFEITDWGDPANWHKMDDPYAVHGKPGGIQWKAWDKMNGALPAFKKNGQTGMSPGPMKLLNDITRRWLAPDGDPSRGVDGFRLDAANEVPHPFWVQWRRLVKSVKPDAYISGEIWSPAQPWINDGKEFDAVMNYQFAMPTVQFFANVARPMKPSAYAKKMGDLINMYPQQASRVMMNLFDSHDTDRVASMFVNPDRGYDSGNRLQDPEGGKYDPRKPTAVERQKMLQAVAMQMTFLGAPMIYYGDEAGMWSPDDPSDRQPMTWPGLKFDDAEVGFDQNTFDTYQRLIAIRNTLPALQTGDYYPIATDDAAGTLVFARGGGVKTVYVAMNRGDKPQTIEFAADGALYDFAGATVTSGTGRPTATPADSARQLPAQEGKISVRVPAYGYAIVSEKP